jgi:RNA polymerase sigma factor (sigma-70 family)
MSSPESTARQRRLGQFARRYYAPLVSFFRRRTRHSADVDDLVQQVFLRLSQHPHVDAIKNPDAYIFQTAANALTDHVRRNVARRRIFDDTGTHEPVEWCSDVSPDRVLQGGESVAQLVAALRTLPERSRDVFMLRCFEGLRYAEIARLQGISVRACESHFAKALARVGHFLGRDHEGTP